MAGKWIECTLSDACSLIDYGLTASATDHDIGPKFLRITDIVSGYIDWKTVPYVSADHDTTAKYRLHDGDIVLARTGASTGASAYVKSPPLAVFASYLVRLQVKSEFNPRFIAYYLRSDDFWTFIRGVLGDKSAQPNASASTMTKAPLRTPKDTEEQRAIAHILGTLDDKIELNRKMNETLEAIARAIFKSWFVDFLPVRRNAAKGRRPSPGAKRHPLPEGEGRGEGVIEGAAFDHLFPDSFENSELGKIPRGWEVKPFVDIIEIISGGTPKTSVHEYWNGDIPWFSIADAPCSSDIWVVNTEKRITSEGVKNSSTQILPVGTTIITARGTVGRIALVGMPMAMNQSCYGLRGKVGVQGLFTYFITGELISVLKQRTHGSVFDTITRDTLAGVDVVVPPPGAVDAFESIVGPSLQSIRANLLQSRTLADLRDTLLPKIISGELRILERKKKDVQ